MGLMQPALVAGNAREQSPGCRFEASLREAGFRPLAGRRAGAKGGKPWPTSGVICKAEAKFRVADHTLTILFLGDVLRHRRPTPGLNEPEGVAFLR
jgi:hypothetical protein